MATLTKKPIQIYLRSEQLEALRSLAGRRNVSVAALIRQAVDRLLVDVPADEDSLRDIIGLFDSGLGDLAAKHDEYLARSIREESA
ncbi:MAG: ribbon-helix-helix protein, CopG family [Chloroflexi bacterium]|nr:ribbon-helix-helix protein, CopG family [Chloroflexota bacterium]